MYNNLSYWALVNIFGNGINYSELYTLLRIMVKGSSFHGADNSRYRNFTIKDYEKVISKFLEYGLVSAERKEGITLKNRTLKLTDKGNDCLEYWKRLRYARYNESKLLE